MIEFFNYPFRCLACLFLFSCSIYGSIYGAVHETVQAQPKKSIKTSTNYYEARDKIKELFKTLFNKNKDQKNSDELRFKLNNCEKINLPDIVNTVLLNIPLKKEIKSFSNGCDIKGLFFISTSNEIKETKLKVKNLGSYTDFTATVLISKGIDTKTSSPFIQLEIKKGSLRGKDDRDDIKFHGIYSLFLSLEEIISSNIKKDKSTNFDKGQITFQYHNKTETIPF